ncbi:response regulator transcription factor [Brevundimonas bacteroides]|uniref:response regulator transcription factor n=1 Tax=Brevundimonas bacteroides TaxID=74311 RepID=UPI0004967E13|nr:winged helix-turn-helix domain-containing protein [Brevundimonas bacteroides]
MAFDRFSTVLSAEATILLVGFAGPSRGRVANLLRSDRVSVLAADDPQAALTVVTDQAIDLVILDERTCGSSAYDFCRTSAVEGGPSILLLAARDDVVSQIVALEVGADEVLPADVDDRLLGAQVRARLRRTRRPTPPTVASGRWSIDSETRMATGPNGTRVELARHQVRLMQVFLAHPGEVITAERLAEQIPDMCLEPAAFRTAMSRLRRRLAPLDSREFLRIVRGRGYVHLPS